MDRLSLKEPFWEWLAAIVLHVEDEGASLIASTTGCLLASETFNGVPDTTLPCPSAMALSATSILAKVTKPLLQKRKEYKLYLSTFIVIAHTTY